MRRMVGAWIAGGTIPVAGFGLAYAVRGRSSAFFGPSVHRGDRSRRILALTFDDGPSESTPALLRQLARHGIRATFFMCGANVRRLPEVAREVLAAGHEIGNHSDTHPRFDFKSPVFIYDQLARAQEAIQAATGYSPRLFRAPYGVRWFGLRSAQKRLGLMGVMWTVLGRDWKLAPTAVSKRLIQGAKNGGILCLHDGRTIQPAPPMAVTIEAVQIALPQLLHHGFRFETVGQLIGASSQAQREPCPVQS
jgi:peptidoglycan-N-acetylglucosamine deacetylase